MDKTFSAEDVIRIYCKNLTSKEKRIVRAFVFKYQTDCSTEVEDECEERNEELKKKLFELNVNMNKYLLIACAFETLTDILLTNDNLEEAVKENKSKIDALCTSIQTESEKIELYKTYVPRGRNRSVFKTIVSGVDDKAELIKKDESTIEYLQRHREEVNNWIQDKLNEMKRKKEEVEENLRNIRDEGLRIEREIKDLFPVWIKKK